MTFLDSMAVPIVAAPMAGGVSTPELVAAVNAAGGLGFLAAGYVSGDAVREQVHRTRELTAKPFGVNIFVPGDDVVDGPGMTRYLARLDAEALRYGVDLGAPVGDDDAWADKLAVVLEERVALVSFTFGCPEPDVVAELHERGSEVLVTVTSAAEAARAADVGADLLCVQSQEAGGHRSTFHNAGPPDDTGLLPLLRQVSAAVSLPIVAAGGLSSGRDVAAVLVAGAAAAQLGTMFLTCQESGTKPEHRAALTAAPGTAVTRAFTGRPARGLVNRFMLEHSAAAPAAYPHIHHVTKGIRAAGDPEATSMWAGQGHRFARDLPAADLVRELATEARTALSEAAARWL